MNALLEIENLHIDLMTTRGIVYAVRGIDLSVGRGEAMGIVGESGCGKSVCVKSIPRLHDEKKTDYHGQIFLDGQDVLKKSGSEMKTLRGGKVGLVFQDPLSALNPIMRVGEQIAEVLRDRKKMNRAEARAETLRLLELTGIAPAEERYRQYPFELSGGMLQRITIAMAISCQPDLLIADEATTALDVTIQAGILELLRQLKEQSGMALIMVTHDFGVVAEICDRVAVMYAGKIVERGGVRAIFDHPRHPYTQALLDSVPKSGAGQSGKGLFAISGTPPDLYREYREQKGCPFSPRCGYRSAACAEFSSDCVKGSEDHVYCCVRE
jgi:oligopeptide/dipeptide ABC transporter ATP-binding protein